MKRLSLLALSIIPRLSPAESATPEKFLNCWEKLQAIEGIVLNNGTQNSLVSRHGKKGDAMGLWVYTKKMAYFIEHPATARFTTIEDAPEGMHEGTTFILTEIPVGDSPKKTKYIVDLRKINGELGFPQNPRFAAYKKRDMPKGSKPFVNEVTASESLGPGSLDVLMAGLKNEIQMVPGKVDSAIKYVPIPSFGPPKIQLNSPRTDETPEKRAHLQKQATLALKTCKDLTGSALSAELDDAIQKLNGPDHLKEKLSH